MTKYVDLGNAQVKLIIGTKRISVCSNIEEVSAEMYGAIQVNDKYYLMGKTAKSKLTTNKIEESKRALLGISLFPYVEEDEKLQVATMLPISLYLEAENREEYAKLLMGYYTIRNANGEIKSFEVEQVNVYCESYSSLATQENIKTIHQPQFVVDLGGADISILYVEGQPDRNRYTTSPTGANYFFVELAKVLTAKMKQTVSTSDCELIFAKYDELNEQMQECIDEFVNSYMHKYVYEKLKDLNYNAMIHSIKFIGGFSKGLMKWITKDSNASVIEDSLFSNIQGVKVLHTMKLERETNA